MSKNIINANIRWLTVILLLVLAVLLLYANLFPMNSSASNSANATVKTSPAPSRTSAPSHTRTPKPTPPPLSSQLGLTLLDKQQHELALDRFDVSKLLHNDPNTDSNITKQVEKDANAHLANRQAALVILYIDNQQIQNPPDVAKKIESLLENLPDTTVYSQAVYQTQPFMKPNNVNSNTQVVLVTYLYMQTS